MSSLAHQLAACLRKTDDGWAIIESERPKLAQLVESNRHEVVETLIDMCFDTSIRAAGSLEKVLLIAKDQNFPAEQQLAERFIEQANRFATARMAATASL